MQVCLANSKVSWTSAEALQAQNPWVLAYYAQSKNLQNHPQFSWVSDYATNAKIVANISHLQALAPKSHHVTKYKFGEQVRRTVKEALKIDSLLPNNLCQEALDKELASTNHFATFCALDKGESIPSDYIQIPYHYMFDVKFDGQ